MAKFLALRPAGAVRRDALRGGRPILGDGGLNGLRA
jgi:hypothetical protein